MNQNSRNVSQEIYEARVKQGELHFTRTAEDALCVWDVNDFSREASRKIVSSFSNVQKVSAGWRGPAASKDESGTVARSSRSPAAEQGPALEPHPGDQRGLRWVRFFYGKRRFQISARDPLLFFQIWRNFFRCRGTAPLWVAPVEKTTSFSKRGT